MHHTAHQAGLDPDRLSFTRTLRIARRHVTDQAADNSGTVTHVLGG